MQDTDLPAGINISTLLDLCCSGIQEKAFPAAAFAIGNSKGTAFGAAGHFTYDASSPKVTEESLFDMASVTKVMATTPAAMLLFDDGALDLDKFVVEYLPAFVGNDKELVTVRNLLLHDSGLPAYATLTKYATKEEAREAVLKLKLKAKPGEQTEYSCMSMITLQQVLESVIGGPMDAFLQKRLWEPLGMTSTLFNPPLSMKNVCVPTEEDKDFRKRLLQGEVHDPAAYACGGVSGNAGLFSSIRDVASYLRLMLDKGTSGSQQIICSKTIETWTKCQSAKSSRALGWDTKSPKGSSAGAKFSLKSFGHTGYTGTSVWVDPKNGFFAALLTNRVYPSAQNDKILAFRPRFHDAAFEVLSK